MVYQSLPLGRASQLHWPTIDYEMSLKYMAKRGRPEEWNQQLQPFNMKPVKPEGGNACHLAVIRLHPIPMQRAISPESARLQDTKALELTEIKEA